MSIIVSVSNAMKKNKETEKETSKMRSSSLRVLLVDFFVPYKCKMLVNTAVSFRNENKTVKMGIQMWHCVNVLLESPFSE